MSSGFLSNPDNLLKVRHLGRELLVVGVVATVLTLLIHTFVVKPFVIPSESMEPTLHGCHGCQNDHVIVDRLTYRFTDPEPGDVIVFHGPPNWGDKDFIKRVIAVGGQTVECCDDQARLLVDGKPLDEPYLSAEPGARTQQPFEKVTVPEGRLWVMGDNRDNSADSRAHGVPAPADGAIPIDNVIGKARLIFLPYSRWQTITDHR